VFLFSIWAFYVPLFGTLINLGLLYWKRHSHPWNFVLLSTFTIMEAFTIGVVIAFYDNIIVLQALSVVIPLCDFAALTSFLRLITLGVFLGLTLFTFQSKVASLTHSARPSTHRSLSTTLRAWAHSYSVAL
jgi:protein lifeguard